MFEWQPYSEKTIESINFFIRQINNNRNKIGLHLSATSSESDVDAEIFLTAQPQQLLSGSEADGPFFTAQQAEESG